MSDPVSTAESDRLAAATLVALEALRASVVDLKGSMADNAVKFSKAATSGDSGYSGNKTSRDIGGIADQRELKLADIAMRRQREAEDAMLNREKSGGTRQMQGPGAMGMLLQKFSAILGPLQLFGQILQSNASGFQILSQATTLLAATLAPVLLPIVLALAAVLLDLSEDIQNQLLPGLKEWSRIIFGTVIPILNELVSMFRAVVDALSNFFVLLLQAPANFRKLWASITGKTSETDKASNAETALHNRRAGMTDKQIIESAKAQGVKESVARAAVETAGRAELIAKHRAAGTSDEEITKKANASGLKGEELANAFKLANTERDRVAAEAAKRSPAFTGAEADGVAARKGGGRAAGGPGAGRRGLDDVLESFRQSIGPKATIQSLGSVGSQAQLAALNGDPIQKRMADYLARIADATEMGARDARPRPPVFGEGR